MGNLNSTRHAVLTFFFFEDGKKAQVVMLIPNKLLLHNNAEAELIKMWNTSSGLKRKVTKIHLMRN